MSHLEAIQKAAQAAFEEWKREVHTFPISALTWERLHEDSKAEWVYLVRVVLNTYNEWK